MSAQGPMIDASGRRHDEWSICLQQVAQDQDREAFAKLFKHFAPLIKGFAINGSALAASHSDELVQEVMIKVWQKAYLEIGLLYISKQDFLEQYQAMYP